MYSLKKTRKHLLERRDQFSAVCLMSMNGENNKIFIPKNFKGEIERLGDREELIREKGRGE